MNADYTTVFKCSFFVKNINTRVYLITAVFDQNKVTRAIVIYISLCGHQLSVVCSYSTHFTLKAQ